jgi:hypothetical protein
LKERIEMTTIWKLLARVVHGLFVRDAAVPEDKAVSPKPQKSREEEEAARALALRKRGYGSSALTGWWTRWTVTATLIHDMKSVTQLALLLKLSDVLDREDLTLLLRACPDDEALTLNSEGHTRNQKLVMTIPAYVLSVSKYEDIGGTMCEIPDEMIECTTSSAEIAFDETRRVTGRTIMYGSNFALEIKLTGSPALIVQVRDDCGDLVGLRVRDDSSGHCSEPDGTTVNVEIPCGALNVPFPPGF